MIPDRATVSTHCRAAPATKSHQQIASRGANRKQGEEPHHPLPHAEQGALVQAGLKAEDIGPDPRRSCLPGHAEPVEHPVLGSQIDGEAAAGNEKENQISIEGNCPHGCSFA